jgi:hypothetical protein
LNDLEIIGKGIKKLESGDTFEFLN